MRLVFVLLMPLLRYQALESYLVRRLFRSAPSSPIVMPSEECDNAKKLLYMSEDAVRRRGKIKNTINNPILRFIREMLCCCMPSCQYEKADYNYFKSRHRLASELDIKRILTTLRYLRSAVKFLTTSSERKWLRL